MNFEGYFLSTRRRVGKSLHALMSMENILSQGKSVLLASQHCDDFVTALKKRGVVKVVTEEVVTTDTESNVIVLENQILIKPL